MVGRPATAAGHLRPLAQHVVMLSSSGKGREAALAVANASLLQIKSILWPLHSYPYLVPSYIQAPFLFSS